MVRKWPQNARAKAILQKRFSFRLHFNLESTAVGVDNVQAENVTSLHVSTGQDALQNLLITRYGEPHTAAAARGIGEILGEACRERGIERVWFEPPVHFGQPRPGINDVRQRFVSLVCGMASSGLGVDINPHSLIAHSRLKRYDEQVTEFQQNIISPLKRAGVSMGTTPKDVEPSYRVVTGVETAPEPAFLGPSDEE